MHKYLLVTGIAAVAAMVGPANGQTFQRRASISGGGGQDWGRCRIEVVVDGAAEVEIRGDNALLRNLSGQPPQFRQFECTSPMPANAPNLRFTGMNGRGSQELVRGPQNGSPAVIRIQDPEGGQGDYAFEMTWGGGGDRNNGGLDDQRDRRPMGPRYTTEQAVRICRGAVRKQASDRFRSANIAFRNTALDNTPGRQDFVTGLLDIRNGYDRDETYRFSCSVNFETGEVRSAQIEPIEPNRFLPGFGDARESGSRAALANCERAVEENLQQKGYQHVDFLSINVDEQQGRKGWIVGNARADVRYRSDSFSFSCSVQLRNGDVRSVDVRRR
jgi:hypothetical protein